jgi:hypothetical protein
MRLRPCLLGGKALTVADEGVRTTFGGPPYSIPNSFHIRSTFAFTSADILISAGQGRVKPSVGHLRVASIPILGPKLGRREAWSSESTGPA